MLDLLIAGPTHPLAHLQAGTLPKCSTTRSVIPSERINNSNFLPGSETLWSVWPHWQRTFQVGWGNKYQMIQDSNFYQLADSNSSGGGHAKSQGNPHKDIGIDRNPIPWQFSYFLHSKHFTNYPPSLSDTLVVCSTISTPVICISFPPSLGAPLLFLLIPMISSFVFIWNLLY